MNVANPALEDSTIVETHHDVVVIGGGPVGLRAARLLAERGKRVCLIGEESHDPYNRVRLTPVLSGDVQFGEIKLDDAQSKNPNLSVHTGLRVVSIDRDARCITTADSTVWHYETLIIATGSNAFVPSIPGADLDGVYTFRTADDTSALLARSFSARNVVIVGGGLLGLEAARGLSRRGCNVTVVEHEDRLMPRQLDIAAATHLKSNIEELGVKVFTATRLAEIGGTDRVESVTLGDGLTQKADTVVICTGVRANISLAREAGLAFERGILVNAQMQTRDPHIFAVGECAQYSDQVIGLVGPGYVQAEVAADAIAGDKPSYEPQIPATKLKVIGADVFSVGDVENLEIKPNVKSYVWTSDTAYRRIFLDRGKLVGVIAVGEWDQASRMQEAAQSGATVYPWMTYRFKNDGQLWKEAEVAMPDMPAAATVCNCTGVNCGQIRAVIAKYPDCTPELVSAETGASTVCGTCRPLVEELIDAGAAPSAVPFSKILMGFSAVAVLLALIPILFGYVPLPESYDRDSLRVWLWRDGIVKQWSGYILLGIFATAMLIGLRKRIRFFDRLGGYDGWRLVHIGIGLAAVIGFFAHTGFRLGSNLNLALGIAFIATLILGAVTGLTTGGDHKLRERGFSTAQKPARRVPTWMHILAVWPLPVLLLFHILTIYAF